MIEIMRKLNNMIEKMCIYAHTEHETRIIYDMI